MIVNTPEDCVKKYLKPFLHPKIYSSQSVGEFAISHNSKLSKINGDKRYHYFQCFKSGQPRSINSSQKIREKNSNKTGT